MLMFWPTAVLVAVWLALCIATLIIPAVEVIPPITVIELLEYTFKLTVPAPLLVMPPDKPTAPAPIVPDRLFRISVPVTAVAGANAKIPDWVMVPV